jgi:ZIP family zinc transporter
LCGAGNLEATWVLALGIAIQDFPEGDFCFNSFVKLGSNKPKSVLLGWLSEIVEPLGAGAVIYIIGGEMIPEAIQVGMEK